MVWVCGCARHQKKKKKIKDADIRQQQIVLYRRDTTGWGCLPLLSCTHRPSLFLFLSCLPNLGFLCVQLGVTNKKARKIPSTRTYDGGWLLLLAYNTICKLLALSPPTPCFSFYFCPGETRHRTSAKYYTFVDRDISHVTCFFPGAWMCEVATWNNFFLSFFRFLWWSQTVVVAIFKIFIYLFHHIYWYEEKCGSGVKTWVVITVLSFCTFSFSLSL